MFFDYLCKKYRCLQNMQNEIENDAVSSHIIRLYIKAKKQLLFFSKNLFFMLQLRSGS